MAWQKSFGLDTCSDGRSDAAPWLRYLVRSRDGHGSPAQLPSACSIGPELSRRTEPERNLYHAWPHLGARRRNSLRPRLRRSHRRAYIRPAAVLAISENQSAALLVATEDDVIYALDAHSGKVVWRKSLGRPVKRSALPCGNISPLGVTGTPVLDDVKAAIYLDALVDADDGSGPQHL